MRYRQLLALIAIFILAACSADQTTAPDGAWLDDLIARLAQAPLAQPPARIIEYEYRGAATYFVPARCCDIPSELYDASGTWLCQPDGGLTGQGDGRCTDFHQTARFLRVVWTDPRA
ncbi:MAG: hypothetical protein MUF51_09005 [Vicinamibacteria bacterium]|jgi:hypothetical protein|nr:hypothetical protein [Vicinamibacteria bacterium]